MLMLFSCGKAYALPQDWPCKTFEIEKYEGAENKSSDDYITYHGQDGDYLLNVNIFWKTNLPLDDCGTAGCTGTIKNVKTGQEEDLRFFCEAENNFDIAKCYIRAGEEYILTKISEEYYRVNLCDNTSYKYVRLNECFGCTCVLHNSDKQNGEADLYMGCKKNENDLHCMTGNIYSETYNPAGSVDDFKNCVGLTSFR